MIEKLNCPSRRGIINAAALCIVFSIALYVWLPSLTSQSLGPEGEMITLSNGVQVKASEVLTLPNGIMMLPGDTDMTGLPRYDGPSRVSGGGIITGIGDYDVNLIVPNLDIWKRPHPNEVTPVLTQLREQYAENPDEDLIHLDITQINGKLTSTVTVNDKTFQVPDGNPAVDKLYGLMSVYGLEYPHDLKIVPPVLIHKVEPVYPEAAKKAGISGSVFLAVGTDDKGEVERISGISGHPDLKEAAMSAVSQWRYEPARTPQTGLPISTSFGVAVLFLSDGTVVTDGISDKVPEAVAVE